MSGITTRSLPFHAAGAATDPVATRGFARLAVGIVGGVTTGSLLVQVRLDGGQWRTLTDSRAADVEITGAGLHVGIDVHGTHEARCVVGTTEANAQADVIMSAYQPGIGGGI